MRKLRVVKNLDPYDIPKQYKERGFIRSNQRNASRKKQAFYNVNKSMINTGNDLALSLNYIM